jgi:hypothetical protein
VSEVPLQLSLNACKRHRIHNTAALGLALAVAGQCSAVARQCTSVTGQCSAIARHCSAVARQCSAVTVAGITPGCSRANVDVLQVPGLGGRDAAAAAAPAATRTGVH